MFPHSLLRATSYEEGTTIILIFHSGENQGSAMLTNYHMPEVTQLVSGRTWTERSQFSLDSEPANLTSNSRAFPGCRGLHCVQHSLGARQSGRRSEGREPGGAAESSVLLSERLTRSRHSPRFTAGQAGVNRMGTVPLFICALVSFFNYTFGKNYKTLPLLIKTRKSV